MLIEGDNGGNVLDFIKNCSEMKPDIKEYWLCHFTYMSTKAGTPSLCFEKPGEWLPGDKCNEWKGA